MFTFVLASLFACSTTEPAKVEETPVVEVKVETPATTEVKESTPVEATTTPVTEPVAAPVTPAASETTGASK
jgi:hypothetical protein